VCLDLHPPTFTQPDQLKRGARRPPPICLTQELLNLGSLNGSTDQHSSMYSNNGVELWALTRLYFWVSTRRVELILGKKEVIRGGNSIY